MPSFKKSLIVEQFQRNYPKLPNSLVAAYLKREPGILCAFFSHFAGPKNTLWFLLVYV